MAHTKNIVTFISDLKLGIAESRTVKPNELKYLLLCSGVVNEKTEIVNKKYGKLMIENEKLKKENERMKNSLLGLNAQNSKAENKFF